MYGELPNNALPPKADNKPISLIYIIPYTSPCVSAGLHALPYRAVM